MTITRRPPRPAAAPAATPVRARKTPESFIDEAHHPVAAPPAPEPEPTKKGKEKGKAKDKEKSKGKEKEKQKKRKDKEAVLVRFEDEQLTLMDERAAALGLSRAAWLRMLVSKVLRGKKS